MPLRVTAHTRSGGKEHTIGSHVLAAFPLAGDSRPLLLGRRSGQLVTEVGSRPALEVAPALDGQLSRVQAEISWYKGAVSIANRSDVNKMIVREWGRRPADLDPESGAMHRLKNGRAIVEVAGTGTYLRIGPDDPYERGWSVAGGVVRQLANRSDDPDRTPRPPSVRDLVRPEVLCGCRRGNNECAPKTSHAANERRLLVCVAGALPLTAWPTPIDADPTKPSQTRIAEQIQVSKPTLANDAKDLRRKIAKAYVLPAKDPIDRFQWLIDERVLDFDDVCDIVNSLS